jgi:hypothetical protein
MLSNRQERTYILNTINIITDIRKEHEVCSQSISGFGLKGKALPLCERYHPLVCRHRSRKARFQQRPPSLMIFCKVVLDICKLFLQVKQSILLDLPPPFYLILCKILFFAMLLNLVLKLKSFVASIISLIFELFEYWAPSEWSLKIRLILIFW